MMKLEDLKNLNPKTPGAWPWPAKVLAFVTLFLGVAIAGALFDWQGQWESLQAIKKEEDSLKETFLAKKKQAINLDLIKKQLTETQESFGALLKQLPSKSEMDALLTDINQAGLGRGLQFELFRPGPETVRDGAFAEQPITIKVTGNYDDIGKFRSDINQAGLGRGLQFELFRPGPETVRDGAFAEQPITIKVTGNYDDIGKF